MNIDALLEELYAYSMFSIRLGLDNIKEICKHLGNPQNSYKVIHITGTNGKGSVSTTVERVLIDAGYQVGKYTSPHILEFNERISFNDKYISNEDVARYYERVKKIIDELKKTGKYKEYQEMLLDDFEEHHVVYKIEADELIAIAHKNNTIPYKLIEFYDWQQMNYLIEEEDGIE